MFVFADLNSKKVLLNTDHVVHVVPVLDEDNEPVDDMSVAKVLAGTDESGRKSYLSYTLKTSVFDLANNWNK